MAAPSLSIDRILPMNAAQRLEFFSAFARYMPDSPEEYSYVIRIGSKTLYSDDTMTLRMQFEAYVKRMRRQWKVRVNR